MIQSIPTKQKIVLFSFLLVTLGGIIVYWYTTKDERQITNNIKEMAHLMTKEHQENGLVMLATASKVANYFATYCQVEWTEQERSREFYRKDIADQVFILRQRANFLLLQVTQLDVQVKDNKATARGVAHIQGLAEDPDQVEEQPVELHFSQTEGKWLVDRIRFFADI